MNISSAVEDSSRRAAAPRPTPQRTAAAGSAAAAAPRMDHADFVRAAQARTLQVLMPRPRAAEYLSRRLLLPFFILPFLGGGVALALIGWLVTGAVVFLIGFIVPRLIKRHAATILFNQALADPELYRDLLDAQVMEVQA